MSDSCHGKLSHHLDLRLRTASSSHTIGDNSDSPPLPPPASATPRILVLLLSFCAANPASNCLKRTYVERHSLMPPQFSVTTDKLAKTFSNVLLSWTSVPRVILSYRTVSSQVSTRTVSSQVSSRTGSSQVSSRTVSSQVSSAPKGSLITVTIAIQKAINMNTISVPSVCHQTVISEASVGHQHAIKGASPWDPSRRAEARRARTERAPSRC